MILKVCSALTLMYVFISCSDDKIETIRFDGCTNAPYQFPELPDHQVTKLNLDPGIDAIKSSCFTSISHGIVLDYDHRIWVTFDGGNAWQASNIHDLIGPTDIYFRDSLHGVISVWQNKKSFLLSTQDGGLHWNKTLFAGGSVHQIVSLDSLTAVAVYRTGNSYQLARSIDAGKTWSIIEGTAKLGTVSTSLDIHASGFGYVGSDKEVWISQDYGQSWVSKPWNFSSVYSLLFFDSLTGYVTTRNGMFVTHDGGDSWTMVNELEISQLTFANTLNAIGIQILDWTLDYDVIYPCWAFSVTEDTGNSFLVSTTTSLSEPRIQYVNELSGFMVRDTEIFRFDRL